MSWLSDNQMLEKIKRNADKETQKAFSGVFPIDSLPEFIKQYPIFIIINTQSHNLPGEHWKVVFINANKEAEVFDSLALPISVYLQRWLNKFSRKWRRNTKSYQPLLSASCGAFAIYYILNRMHVTNFDSLLSVFTKNPSVNESTVLNFYKCLK